MSRRERNSKGPRTADRREGNRGGRPGDRKGPPKTFKGPKSFAGPKAFKGPKPFSEPKAFKGPNPFNRKGPQQFDRKGPQQFDRKKSRVRPQHTPIVTPPRRAFPAVEVQAPSEVRPGEWLWTTRAEAEIDLIEELAFAKKPVIARVAGPSLVAADEGSPDLTFARQGFKVGALVHDAGHAANALVKQLNTHLARGPRPWALDVWVPDHDDTNRFSAQAAKLEEALFAQLSYARPDLAALRVPTARAALDENGFYAQLCLFAKDRGALGVIPARDAPSLAPGGRLRVHFPDAAPSRAAMKLLEAFVWLNREPEPNELCVDLGAAPGGWTWVLLQKRARVIAIDPGDLAPDLRNRKGLEHVRGDAFRFEPPEDDPVDWLFCDMAFRPLEAAALLGKWARNRWARMLIANIKMPMRKKAENLFRVREILELGGWKSLRTRQLYHDREEITVAAVRV